MFSTEWNRRKACPVFEGADEKRKEYLLSLYEKIQKEMRELEGIILLLQRKGTAFSADDVVLKYLELKENRFFFTFMRKVIGQLRDAGKIRTCETYAATLNSLIRFRDGKDFSIEELTSGFLLSYETWLKSRGVSMNTVSFYMRILRAVNNRAVAEGIVEQRYPFKQVYTGNEKTVKRAVTLDHQRAESLGLSDRLSLCTCPGHVPFQFLYAGHVLYRYGVLKESGFERRRPFLSEAEDRATALHQMGTLHAGTCRTLRGRTFPLSVIPYPEAGRE